MNIRSRPVLVVSSILGGFLIASYSQSFQQYGLDVWNVYENEAEIRRGEQEGSRLNDKAEEIVQRTYVRTIITQEVVHERMKLANAAERYRELNQFDPVLMDNLRRYFPGESDQISAALQVIKHVEVQLHDCFRDEPFRSRDIIRRLRVELAALRASDSALRFQGQHL